MRRAAVLGGLLAVALSASSCIRIMIQPRAVERFASPTGSDLNAPCTNPNAPCSMAAALQQLVCGDTLTLKSGTYRGSSSLLLV